MEALERNIKKKTKIVCTIGPSSDNLDTLIAMIEEGMNVARINFSHGTHEEHLKKIELIKQAREIENVPIAIMLDTKGPEIRTGLLEDGTKVELKKGEPFILTTEDMVGNENIVSVSYEGLPQDLKPGDIVLIDDGLIALGVDRIEGNKIYCVVTNEGFLGERKSINIPNVSISLPGLTEKDINDLLFGIKNDVDFIAASFIRRAADVIAIRHILDSNNGSGIKIISKIESQEGVSNIDEILKVSDGIMVARGDLGVEVPAQDVPIIQKKIIKKCVNAGKPVITATQMLDSMIRNPRPTRAEVTDVANAVFDGTDAVMLSGETASGEYPVAAVKTMSEIVQVAEVADEFKLRMTLEKHEHGISNAVSEAAVSISVNLRCPAIIAATAGGMTARSISKFRPDAYILATSFNYQTIRQLSLSWGVFGIHIPEMTNSNSLVNESVKAAVKSGWLKAGNNVVIAAGVPVGSTGSTNMLRVSTVGESSLSGKSYVTNDTVTGIARNVRFPNEEIEERFTEGDILIVPRLTSDNLHLARMAGAVITEDEAELSKLFLDELKDIPIITDVEDVFEHIRDGSLITVDSYTGTIRQGSYR